MPNKPDYFNLCFKFTMAQESTPKNYKSDTKGDEGGKTVLGISARWHGKELVDKLWAMNYDNALIAVKPIYWRNYWLPIQGGEIENANFALCKFDYAVNSGVQKANKIAENNTTVDSFCNARIDMLRKAYPKGYILADGRDILPELIARVERCRNWKPDDSFV